MSPELTPPSGAATRVAATTGQPVGARAGRLWQVWLRLALFLMPALLVVCLPVYLIDPYGLFARSSIVADSVRSENAARVNQALQAIVTFTRSPAPNILLGDSQMAHFKLGDIEAITHRPFSNLSYGGGTLAESISSFWYATRITRLQSVYFGVSFYSFIDSSRNRVSAAERLVDNPLVSFASGDVLEATWDDILGQFLHHAVSYRPTVDAATFWQQQLGELLRRKASYPASTQTLTQLAAIVHYCKTHDIMFAFVIPPQHEDVRRRIAQLGMERQYADFKGTVTALAATYDCDVANEITRDAGNFQDPFHTTPVAADAVARSIWTDHHTWCEAR
jgi:hypothetical protein